MAAECKRRMLSQGPHCTLEICGCGVVHLTVGPVSLRLEPEVAATVSATLASGMAQLAELGPAPARLRLVESCE